jgi:hypothetical protein
MNDPGSWRIEQRIEDKAQKYQAKHRFMASRNTLSQRTGAALSKEAEGADSPVCIIV